ncbi:hypothetical protein MBAV_003780 [Candidatus Magnetobacterium bavaricum]|uniref:Uncharacterized protein n=1 Tax=Candidatus Magnetobacterium bavaricum TaxID=29290 RepID=A0A0F3GQ46_9BACT|nr:hypothetical protein MBAV_003780 [Candidatus Magnetobacterium bavaricum]
MHINPIPSLSNSLKLSSSKKALSILIIIGTVMLYPLRIASAISFTIFITALP